MSDDDLFLLRGAARPRCCGGGVAGASRLWQAMTRQRFHQTNESRCCVSTSTTVWR